VLFWDQTFHHEFKHFHLFIFLLTKETKKGFLGSKELHIHIREQVIFLESYLYEIKGQTIETILTCCKDTDIFINVL